MVAAEDGQIVEMQQMLARLEGIWVEPASAAGLAGLAAVISQGRLDVHGQRVVAICTGHGLKDPDIVTRSMPRPDAVAPDLGKLAKLLALD